MKIYRFSILKAAVIALVLSSCSETKHYIPEVLSAYIVAQHTLDSIGDGYSAYFDLSDGMLSAYGSDVNGTKNALKSVVNKVTGNKNCTNVYTLKNAVIEKSELRQTDLYNYILNPSSYSTTAPIEETLKKVAKEGKAAFLLTDFEEYANGVIQQQNYAKQYFIDWLKRGNSIFFFITDYVEGGKNKHLYFTVFDTPSHLLLHEIQDAMKGTGMNSKLFVLTNNIVTFSNNYPAVSIGGAYHERVSGEDIVSCTNETGEKDCYTFFEGQNAEFYPFEESWPNIVANANGAKEDGNDPRFTHLLSGLKADFSLMTGYEVEGLNIAVYDIQEDYDKFAGFYAYLKDNDNADDQGQILPEYDYRKSRGGVSAVKDMFVFGGKVENGKADIAIDFRPYFSGEVANMPMTDMLRVDVVISGCEPNYDILHSLFEWEGNRSLVEAIKNTLQDQNPIDKVIYTYYIKSNVE